VRLANEEIGTGRNGGDVGPPPACAIPSGDDNHKPSREHTITSFPTRVSHRRPGMADPPAPTTSGRSLWRCYGSVALAIFAAVTLLSTTQLIAPTSHSERLPGTGMQYASQLSPDLGAADRAGPAAEDAQAAEPPADAPLEAWDRGLELEESSDLVAECEAGPEGGAWRTIWLRKGADNAVLDR
jgi:hypothetical protein